MRKDAIVKDSKIEGKGVFAARDFKKGEIVIKWKKDFVLSQDEVEKLPEEEKKYVSGIGKGNCLLLQAPEKFVNHSCNANTHPKNNCEVAVRDIKKGEEITSDYSLEDTIQNFKCNCSSKNCNGRIIKKLEKYGEKNAS